MKIIKLRGNFNLFRHQTVHSLYLNDHKTLKLLITNSLKLGKATRDTKTKLKLEKTIWHLYKMRNFLFKINNKNKIKSANKSTHNINNINNTNSFSKPCPIIVNNIRLKAIIMKTSHNTANF